MVKRMPTSRLLKSGKGKKSYSFFQSTPDRDEADRWADNLRGEGKNAVVRKGGTKWDVFQRN